MKQKIIRNMETEENREFWKSAKETTAPVKDWPVWKRGGIDVRQSGLPKDEKI